MIFFLQISLITFLDVPGEFLAFSSSGAQKSAQLEHATHTL